MLVCFLNCHAQIPPPFPPLSVLHLDARSSHRGVTWSFIFLSLLSSAGLKLNVADLFQETLVLTGPLDVALTTFTSLNSLLALVVTSPLPVPNLHSQFLVSSHLGDQSDDHADS